MQVNTYVYEGNKVVALPYWDIFSDFKKKT